MIPPQNFLNWRLTVSVGFIMSMLLGILALSARPFEPSIPWVGSSHSGSPFLDALLIALALLCLLGSVLIASVLKPNRRRKRKDDEWEQVIEQGPTNWTLILTVLVIWLLLTVTLFFLILHFLSSSVLGSNYGTAGSPHLPAPASQLPPNFGVAVPPILSSPPGLPSWFLHSIIPTLAILFILLLVGSLVQDFRQRRTKEWGEVLDGQTTVANIIEEGIDALQNEPDPRRAVIRAYARMEATAARQGVPRRVAEAPFEFLERLVDRTRASPDPVVRLTLIYEQARFSHHIITAAMKEEAITLLVQIRDELDQHAYAEQQELTVP
ncbi:MAG: DUF4129 domain-containing protein [Chloroflexi bacterium]|nr:DUF4129 domain-containing protein [Chloroflexota bacterium]